MGSSTKKQLADYAKFHYDFERIHPFIIRDENRSFYIRGLQQFAKEPGYLIDTFEQSTDHYKITFEQIYGTQNS